MVSGDDLVKHLLSEIAVLDAQWAEVQQQYGQAEAECKALKQRRSDILTVLASVAPLVHEAKEALGALSQGCVEELRTLHCPPPILQRAVEVIYLILQCQRLEASHGELLDVDWNAAKQIMCPDLLQQLARYDPRDLSVCPSVMNWVGERYLGLARDETGTVPLADLSSALSTTSSLQSHIARRMARRRTPPPDHRDLPVAESPKAKPAAKPKPKAPSPAGIHKAGHTVQARSTPSRDRSRSCHPHLIRATSMTRNFARLHSTGGAKEKPIAQPTALPAGPTSPSMPRGSEDLTVSPAYSDFIVALDADIQSDGLVSLSSPAPAIPQPVASPTPSSYVPVTSIDILEDLLGEPPPEHQETFLTSVIPIYPDFHPPIPVVNSDVDSPHPSSASPSAATPEEALTVATVSYANKTCGLLFRWCLSQLQYAGVMVKHGSILEEGRDLDRRLADRSEVANVYNQELQRLKTRHNALLAQLQKLLDVQYLHSEEETLRQKAEKEEKDAANALTCQQKMLVSLCQATAQCQWDEKMQRTRLHQAEAASWAGFQMPLWPLEIPSRMALKPLSELPVFQLHRRLSDNNPTHARLPPSRRPCGSLPVLATSFTTLQANK